MIRTGRKKWEYFQSCHWGTKYELVWFVINLGKNVFCQSVTLARDIAGKSCYVSKWIRCQKWKHTKLSPSNVKPQMCMYQKVELSTTYHTAFHKKEIFFETFWCSLVSFFCIEIGICIDGNLAVVSVHVFLEVPWIFLIFWYFNWIPRCQRRINTSYDAY